MFRVEAQDAKTRARAGVLATARGEASTPLFMPVATKGAVKTLTADEVASLGYEVVLSNLYHVLERPGIEVIEAHGGLHGFMGWRRAMLTDSGGYQVYSLHRMVRVEEDGVSFRSLIDGRERRFTPESVIAFQERLGSDIAMQLDVCLGYGAPREKVRAAMETTIAWGARSLAARSREGQLVFGIVQGGFFPDLREESATRTVSLGFDGYALGGLSVGEPLHVLEEMAEVVVSRLPADRPRYIMGLGDPVGVLAGIALGVDMFDSALPTRVARGGSAFTRDGVLNIRNAAYERDLRPLDEECPCPACTRFTRSYLRHLYLSEETMALRMLTLHNLTFMKWLVDAAREAIVEGRFAPFRSAFVARYGAGAARDGSSGSGS